MATGTNFPFTCHGVVTGLTVGTRYWFDLKVSTASGTIALSNVTGSVVEI